MPKSPENRIGQIFGRWKILEENQRGLSIDHGKTRLKTRFFKIECTQCNYRRESVSYKNIYYDKISHVCRTEWEKSFDGLMLGKYGVNIVGKQINNYRDFKFNVISVRVPQPGEYDKFKTLVYVLECPICEIKKNVIHQQLTKGDYSICQCWKKIPVPEAKTRQEMIKDIDDEFIWMLELNKEGQLINYLKNKFPHENWDIILKEEY